MAAPSDIPEKMKTLVVTKFQEITPEANLSECLEVREVDTPKPKSGEVLVRMAFASVNPADLMTVAGLYNPDASPTLPFTGGFEGSGVVVASGGGMTTWGLVGKRVGVVTQGSWSEYAIVPATQCVALPDGTSLEAGCGCFVNPGTVVGFVEVAKARKTKAIVHTAAASALGKMLVRHARLNGIEVINVVRREAQVETLKGLGATHIVNTSEEGWEQELATKCTELNAHLAFEAIGGEMTGKILRALPNNSEVMLYGALSGQAAGDISPTDLIFKSKRLGAFWLSEHLAKKSLVGKIAFVSKFSKCLTGSLATDVRGKYELDAFDECLKGYIGNMSAGKVLFKLAGEIVASRVAAAGQQEEPKKEGEGEEEPKKEGEEEPKKEGEGEEEPKKEGEEEAKKE